MEQDETDGDTAHNLYGDSVPGKINTDSTATSEEITEVADSITQEEIDTVLMRGSGFEKGKFRIYDNCRDDISNKDFAKFLKNEYGTGGSSADENGVRKEHDSKGLHLAKGDIFNPSAEITLNWNKVAKRIRELINSNVYLNDKELDEFATYFIENLVGEKLVIDNREYKVEKIENGKAYFEDITFENSTGFPILRSESVEFVINEIEKKTNTSDDIEQMQFSFDNLAEQSQPYTIIKGETQETEKAKEEKPQETTAEKQLIISKTDYIYNSENEIIGGAKARFIANVEAIKCLKNIEKENRLANTDEQQILSRYSGWGGTASAFSSSDKDWSEEYTTLKNLLDESEYTEARASTLTSFYTPPEITQSINSALSQSEYEIPFEHEKELKEKSERLEVVTSQLAGDKDEDMFTAESDEEEQVEEQDDEMEM